MPGNSNNATKKILLHFYVTIFRKFHFPAKKCFWREKIFFLRPKISLFLSNLDEKLMTKYPKNTREFSGIFLRVSSGRVVLKNGFSGIERVRVPLKLVRAGERAGIFCTRPITSVKLSPFNMKIQTSSLKLELKSNFPFG